MAGDFDYVALAAPTPTNPVSFQEIIDSITDMGPEEVSFVGGMYGEPGMGKTTAAMELMQKLVDPDKRILYIYTGTNWSSLMNFPHLMARTKKIKYKSFEQIKAISEMLRNESIREKMKIGGVIFDEYNTMYEQDLDLIVGLNAHLINSGPKRKNKEGQDIYKDPHTPQWPDYNIAKTHVIDVMNNVLNVEDTHFMFVCHARLQKISGKQEPDMNNAAAQVFIRSLHSLYYLENAFTDSGKMQRMIQLQGTGQTVAKNRIGGLPNKVETVDPIAEAFSKWGIVEERDAVPQTAPEEKVSEPETVQESQDVDLESFLG